MGGAIGGLVLFFRGIEEYILKNRLARFQQFIAQRKEFEASKELCGVNSEVLKGESNDMSGVEWWHRTYYLVFMENIALMMNSRLIDSNVVHNTWGASILACFENNSFWADIDKDRMDTLRRSPYWRVFYKLHDDMQAIDREVKKAPGRTRRYKF